MTITLSLQDYWDLFEEAESGGETVHSFSRSEAVWTYPQRLGKGSYREVRLRPGVSLAVFDYTLWDCLCLQKPARDHPLEFGFCLAGHSLDQEGGGLTPGHHFLCGGRMPGGFLEEPAQQQIQTVTIHMEPQILKEFIVEEAETLPVGLKRVIEEVSDAPYFEAGAITPAMNLILHQILSAPYQGITRQLYLEGKVLELIALQLQQISERLRKPEPAVLRREEIDRIHHAKDILVRQLEQPPSLQMLARQVGLNEHKLKVGFRQIFNTTVFGYLYHHRMEQARQLLEAGEMTVTSVAYAVGYANRSHFAAAFRRKFGINPGCYLKNI